MWILFDDARSPADGEALLFDAPHETIVARTVTDVPAALDRLRGVLAKGHHVAGYLAYEAGYALDPATTDLERCGEGPLVSFGVWLMRNWQKL